MKKPNTVFLFNDHQVYYRHGWDGGPMPLRPHFDRLANEGINFTRAYTACPLCLPARRTVATGMLPHNHWNVQNDDEAPASDHELYFETLHRLGYRNYYFGKWHTGAGTAHDYCCDGFSYPSYGNPYLTPEYERYLAERCLPHAAHHVERLFWPIEPAKIPEPYYSKNAWLCEVMSGLLLTPKESHEAFFLAHQACETLKELAKDDTPFALRVDFWGPHIPYFPTREFADRYRAEEIPEYPSLRDTLSDKPESYKTEPFWPMGMNKKLVQPSPIPWPEWQQVLARAYANVTMVDAAAGQILQALDELGLRENTIVVWTTDHGDGIASHGGHLDKGSYMPEEVMRIPMAVRWPGEIRGGQVSEQLVSLMDVAPTLLEAVGGEFEHKPDGASLLPLCTGSTNGWREDLMCETHGHHEECLVGRLLVHDHYKYMITEGQRSELYDLEADPYEMTNLHDDPAHAPLLADMRQRLARWRRHTNDVESWDELVARRTR